MNATSTIKTEQQFLSKMTKNGRQIESLFDQLEQVIALCEKNLKAAEANYMLACERDMEDAQELFLKMRCETMMQLSYAEKQKQELLLQETLHDSVMGVYRETLKATGFAEVSKF